MSDETILDVVTGKETFRNYTKKEKEELSQIVIDGKDQIDAVIAKEKQKNILKQEAVRILQTLGLTEDQAKAIAGL
jgi:DNA gyrase/topoisomerase IV subunit A